MLNIKSSYFDNILYIKLKGILTKETVHILNKKVTNLVTIKKISNIIFNLTDLKYIDIKGINTLFITMNYVKIIVVIVIYMELIIILEEN